MSDKIEPPQPEENLNNEAFDHLRKRIFELEDRFAEKDTSLDDQHRRLLIREIEQKIQLRQLMVVVAIAVLIVMSLTLAHGMHKVMWGPFLTVPRMYAVALVAAPIVSITTIMTVLLVGTFRGVKDRDSESLASAASDALRAVSGQA